MLEVVPGARRLPPVDRVSSLAGQHEITRPPGDGHHRLGHSLVRQPQAITVEREATGEAPHRETKQEYAVVGVSLVRNGAGVVAIAPHARERGPGHRRL